MVEPAARPGVPSLLISSPAFLVAEFRWQWYVLASVPTALAASLGALTSSPPPEISVHPGARNLSHPPRTPTVRPVGV